MKKIIKVGRIVYMNLFDRYGQEFSARENTFKNSDGKIYDCRRIFWKFYWIVK